MSFQPLRNEDLLLYGSTVLSSRHGFTTRLGGVSRGYLASMNLGTARGDTEENVQKNFAILGRTIGFSPENVVFSAQVHEDTVRVVTEEDRGKGLVKPLDYHADALITDIPGLALTVFSADCGMILLEDPVSGAVGAVHAGWRGTALGIAGKAAKALCRVYGAAPENLRASIGPSIGKCCFETDEDVPSAMRERYGAAAEAFISKTDKKYHVDLKGINALSLRLAGIPGENIDICDLCSHCRQDLFWSYRASGNCRGSQGAIIVCGGPR